VSAPTALPLPPAGGENAIVGMFVAIASDNCYSLFELFVVGVTEVQGGSVIVLTVMEGGWVYLVC